MDGDLTTLAAVKLYLSPVPPAGDDALLSSLISGASAYVTDEIGMALIEETYVRERYNGPGGTTLVLRHRPVCLVSEVRIEGRVVPRSSSPTVAGFVADDAAIFLRGYTFCRGAQNVEATYTAGYETIPADIIQAVNEAVVLTYKRRDTLDYQSKQLAGEVITFWKQAFPAMAQATLERRRDRVPA